MFALHDCRYYKNAIPQESGWNVEVVEWCKFEADRQRLQEGDRWGCLIIDEMKIQVYKLQFIDF